MAISLHRHRFERPNYATARRMTSCEAMPDTETKKAWRLFAKDAQRLYDEHSPAHPDMKIQDLILGMLCHTLYSNPSK